MKELDHNGVENARRIARESLAYVDPIKRCQMRGIHDLYLLCIVLGLAETDSSLLLASRQQYRDNLVRFFQRLPSIGLLGNPEG